MTKNLSASKYYQENKERIPKKKKNRKKKEKPKQNVKDIKTFLKMNKKATIWS